MGDGGGKPAERGHSVLGPILGLAPLLVREILEVVYRADRPGPWHDQGRHRHTKNPLAPARAPVNKLAARHRNGIIRGRRTFGSRVRRRRMSDHPIRLKRPRPDHREDDRDILPLQL